MPARALVLVRNAVTHDARVLREAQTLRAAGYQIAVAGVVSTAEPQRRVHVEGIEVVRIDPRAGPLRRRCRRRGGAARGSTPPARPGQTAPGDPAPPRDRARLRRLAVTLSYNARGIRLARRARPDLVHANDYNTMWIALGAKLMCGSRVVYDAHELWADRNGRTEWRPWLVACEAAFVRLADATITASPGYADAMGRRYRVAPPTVIRNIPAGPRPAPRMAAPDRPSLAVYVGGLMPGRGLEIGIRALAEVPALRMRLIGPGAAAYRASLVSLAGRCGVADRFELAEPVSPGAVVAAAAGASLGLALIEPVCRSYELTLPNKLFEYAQAGVPMLASDLPVIGALVRAHGLGEAVRPTDETAVAAAMRRLLDPGRNAAARERVQRFADENPWTSDRHRLAEIYSRLSAPC
jgi:glycosyltransferase involved in cell wall biosynthesis